MPILTRFPRSRVPALTLAATVALAATAATAQVVTECDWRASAQALVEPWEDYSRAFANGDVRIALSDAIEPGAGALHLVVLSPSYEEMGGRICSLVTLNEVVGFAGVDFAAMTAQYDPARGLTLTVPVTAWLPQTDGFEDAILSFTLNQATGRIDASLR